MGKSVISDGKCGFCTMTTTVRVNSPQISWLRGLYYYHERIIISCLNSASYSHILASSSWFRQTSKPFSIHANLSRNPFTDDAQLLGELGLLSRLCCNGFVPCDCLLSHAIDPYTKYICLPTGTFTFVESYATLSFVWIRDECELERSCHQHST